MMFGRNLRALCNTIALHPPLLCIIRSFALKRVCLEHHAHLHQKELEYW